MSCEKLLLFGRIFFKIKRESVRTRTLLSVEAIEYRNHNLEELEEAI